MDNKKEDIRITKTRKALAETLIELLSEKKFQKLTINDICQRAMVSRSTFYQHFEDKYQLVHYCIQVEHERIEKLKEEKDSRAFIRMIFESVKERQQIFHNLLFAEVNLELLNMFRQLFYEFVYNDFTKAADKGAKLGGPLPVLAAYHSNGMAGMTMWWIEKGFDVSIDEMAACLYHIMGAAIPD